MIVFILVLIGWIIALGAIVARSKKERFDKTKHEITHVGIICVTGSRCVFEIQRNDETTYETYNIGSEICKELMGMVEK